MLNIIASFIWEFILSPFGKSFGLYTVVPACISLFWCWYAIKNLSSQIPRIEYKRKNAEKKSLLVMLVGLALTITIVIIYFLILVDIPTDKEKLKNWTWTNTQSCFTFIAFALLVTIFILSVWGQMIREKTRKSMQ